jgi:hypothetical protein
MLATVDSVEPGFAGGGFGAATGGAAATAAMVAPQCTQNFALGCSSLLQFVHFIAILRSGWAMRRAPRAGAMPPLRR